MSNMIITDYEFQTEIDKLGRFRDIWIDGKLTKSIDCMDVIDQPKLFWMKLFLGKSGVREYKREKEGIRIITGNGNTVEIRTQDKKYLSQAEIKETIIQLSVKGSLTLEKAINTDEGTDRQQRTISTKEAIEIIESICLIQEERFVLEVNNNAISFFTPFIEFGCNYKLFVEWYYDVILRIKTDAWNILAWTY